MQIDYPLHFDQLGRTAHCDEDEHVRDLVEQVLFTIPGERVNRPDFGSPLLNLVFEPNSDAIAAAVELAVQAALQQWLSEVVLVEAVRVENVDSVLNVSVQYVVRRTQQRQVSRFQRDGGQALPSAREA
jgi:phage baseplate assembly protein W